MGLSARSVTFLGGVPGGSALIHAWIAGWMAADAAVRVMERAPEAVTRMGGQRTRRRPRPRDGEKISAMRMVLAFLALACAACGGSSQAAHSTDDLKTRSLPEADVAWRLGHEIWENDLVSARATDLAAPHIPPGAGARGWVTTRAAEGWQVDFYSLSPSGPASVFRVTFAGPPLRANPRSLDPPEPLSNDRVSMIRAVETAQRATFPRCARKYNQVTLPAGMIGREGWLVYLLAAHQEQGEVVLGGHARVLVSADGDRIVETTPLSKGCMVQPPLPPGARPVGIVLATPMTDRPFETHVFLSLLHGRPLYLAARGTLWKIEPPAPR